MFSIYAGSANKLEEAMVTLVRVRLWQEELEEVMATLFRVRLG